LQFQIEKRGPANRLAVTPEFTQTSTGKIIGSTHWQDADGRRQERFQVITLRDDGKIADIQGCSSRRAAERFARRA
jgi:hypothetical protein